LGVSTYFRTRQLFMSTSRQLAAIMFTDIVGYTALMGKDSAKALELIRISKEIQKPLVEKHHGKWLKEMGDGALCSFGSALDAVNCAVEIQKSARAELDAKLRIGIHLGDVIVEEDDVHGDGVNVASRLESITDPGGIYVSESIEKAIRGQSDIQAKYLGEVRLKNVDYGVRTYAVQGVGLPVPEFKDQKELSGHFWAELQRRGVIRAGTTYLMIALLLILLLPYGESTVDLPEWTTSALITALLIGFPMAMYLAWNYERSPEGFVRTTSKQSWQNPLKASQRKPLTGNFIIVVLILVIMVMYAYPKYLSTPDADPTAGIETTIEDKSIGVLPIVNMSGDPGHEPFCDGMTDAVISRLTKISSLGKVISRTSMFKYKGTDKSVPEIAKELGVTHILESSFQKEGDQIKINLQLIDGATDDHIWSVDYFDVFKDKFQIQADVAENVARNLDVQITDIEVQSIRKIPTNNEEAYNLFLQAEFQRYKQNESAFENAIPLYEQVIALDSNFAEAYIGLANLLSTGGLVWGIYDEQEAWGKAKKLLQKAVDIDSTNVQLYDQLYMGYFYYDWDFDLVEKYYQAIRHRANFDFTAVTLAADYPIKTGRYNQSLSAINKWISSDPSVGIQYSFMAQALMYLGEKDEAIDLLETVDPLYSDEWGYLRESAKLYYYLGEHEKSKNQLRKIMANFPDRPPILLWLNAVNHHMDGNSQEGKRYLSELKKRYQEGGSGSPAWFIALYYCHIENYQNAFEWLQKSYDRHEVEMTWFREEPLLIPLREDPRYKELYRKVGFPTSY